MPDDSERAAAGILPDDPTADTDPMGPPTVPPKLSALLPDAFARMRARHARTETPIRVPWPTLAAPLGGGLWPGLHVFVGNTGAGKTQWCLQVALHAAQAGTPVLYVALEAGDVEFVARCLGLVAGQLWSPLYHGRHDALETLIRTHTPALDALPLHVQFAPPHGWDVGGLDVEVQQLRETYPEPTPGARPLLVVLDFLQIIGGEKDGRREDLRERIGRAAYVGRGIARTHNAVVLLASSTARENYLALAGRKRASKGGGTENDTDNKLGEGSPARLVGVGKESGEIEFAADTVLVLTQKPWDDHTPPRGGTVCHLALAKVRAGTPAWVKLQFDGRTFTEPRDETGESIRI